MSERGRGEDVATHIAEDIVVCWGDKKRAKTTLRKGVDYSSQKHVILMNGAMHLELISDTAGADDEADVELETIERRRVTIINPDEDICTTMGGLWDFLCKVTSGDQLAIDPVVDGAIKVTTTNVPVPVQGGKTRRAKSSKHSKALSLFPHGCDC